MRSEKQIEISRAWSNWLRRVRTERHLSQAQLGELTGVSPAVIEYWEQREGMPLLADCVLIAQTLGYPLDTFLVPENAPQARKRGRPKRDLPQVAGITRKDPP